METSPRLSLSYVQPQQAQKHVTVNESLRRLDALVSLAVVSKTETDEPADPPEGAAYILPGAASGAAWSGFAAGAVAAFQDGAWREIAPPEGLRAWVSDAAALFVYDGSVWSAVVSGGGVGSTDMLGVNATPDTVNRFAVKSDAALLSHDDVTPGTGDARQIISKASAARTASVVFQNGFSGRAEFGLAGDDDFHMKVSADGETFLDGVVIDKDNGKVSFPQGLAAALSVSDGGTGATSALDALDALGLRAPLGNISDDNAVFADFGGPIAGAAILAVSNSVATCPTAFFYARMAPTASMTTLFSAGPAPNIGVGARTGTTGPDGSVNFSVTGDGKFYVENRIGIAVGYTLFVFRR